MLTGPCWLANVQSHQSQQSLQPGAIPRKPSIRMGETRVAIDIAEEEGMYTSDEDAGSKKYARRGAFPSPSIYFKGGLWLQ